MTKKQREDFEYALRALDADDTRDNNSARAGNVATALRILSARFDEIERRLDLISRTAQRADTRTRSVGGRP